LSAYMSLNDSIATYVASGTPAPKLRFAVWLPNEA
jgi:hypothetical protein